MTYLGLALLAVGMWGQQHAQPEPWTGDVVPLSTSCWTNGHPCPGWVTLADGYPTRTDEEPAVVPAVEEEQEYGLATCRQAPECEGKPTCNLATCKRATRPYWTCPDKSNYELHSTVDGSKHWCERAPEVAK